MATENAHENTTEDTIKNTTTEAVEPSPATQPQRNWLQRAWHGYLHHKKWSIPATVVAILGLLMAIPVTRYALLGLGVTQSYTITVTDGSTHTSISNATVTLDGKKATTNNKGQVTVRGHVGKQVAKITKQYYKSSTVQVFVGISSKHNAHAVQLVATGRQVPIVVINAITKQPVENATVSAQKTTVKTDSKGRAVITLPTSSTTQSAQVTANGYNAASAKIEVTSSVVEANTFAITPSGKAYFLSNADGTMNVMSANLDGTDRKVLVAGTGKEIPSETRLIQSSDSQFLALQSRRDGGQYDKLFLINTSNGQLSTIDEGDATFSLVGWSEHRLIYNVYRDHMEYWQAKRAALKSFSADTKKLTTLVENSGEGDKNNYAYQSVQDTYVVDTTVLYSTTWYSPTASLMNGRTWQIVRINTDGSGKKVLKEVPQQPNQNTYGSSRVTKPQEIYYNLEQSVYGGDMQNTYLRYANGAVSTVPESSAQAVFNKPATDYYSSPNGDQTFWAEKRDGKNTLFIGDKNAGDPKQIATQSDYQPLGWASSTYVLVSKDGSELYVLSVNGGPALKISDYYAIPQQQGYGH